MSTSIKTIDEFTPGEVIVGLVETIRQHPVSQYIWDIDSFYMADENLDDQRHANAWVHKHCHVEAYWGAGINQAGSEDAVVYKGDNLVVYTDGPIDDLAANLIRACAYNGVSLKFMCYDSVSGTYNPLIIFP